MAILVENELRYLKSQLGRLPNMLEQFIISAEWSEHCSYKSSKRYLRFLPKQGKRILIGPGYDAGVLDIGNNYVITVHIESHNHPSAVDPYGGAATGVGGVIRDILSMGTRPIGLLNALRFSYGGNSLSQSDWLIKNVVRGIADYGNCIGIPTVGGEVEFDSSFEDYCLVDVASVGLGLKKTLIKNTADTDDLLILVGGSTGKDGIHGASFASKKLDEDNRSAVQIPDPFLEKLLIDATIEGIENKCIKAMKDLGGGGLACCLSESSDNLKKGFEIDLEKVHLKHNDMTDYEVMISESQERMLFICDISQFVRLKDVLDKYTLKYSIIGKVADHEDLVIRKYGEVIARMPSSVITHAPLYMRKSEYPTYLKKIDKTFEPQLNGSLTDAVLKMLENPTISSKEWIYRQFDHEVGLRTVIKPGQGDAAVLLISDNKYISMSLDGNSKFCYADPYTGTLSCLSESIRNTVCVGSEPIGIIDHLQFGNPENPEIFWTFKNAVYAISDFCKFYNLPVVGGKVSFYNETKHGNIKPSPIIGCLGLISHRDLIRHNYLKDQQTLFIIGLTQDELGGSEYYEYYHNFVGGKVPSVDLNADKKHAKIILNMVKHNLIDSIHDCSKGGLIIALLEMLQRDRLGIRCYVDAIPNNCHRLDNLLFSESNSRYLLGTTNPDKLSKFLKMKNICFGIIGKTDNNGIVTLYYKKKEIVNLDIDIIKEKYNLVSNSI